MRKRNKLPLPLPSSQNIKKCFICASNAGPGLFLSPEESSFVLADVLGIPGQWIREDEIRKVMFENACYCRLCLNRLMKVRTMSREVQTLEKKIQTEILRIEQQLRESYVQGNPAPNSSDGRPVPVGMLQILREQIVKEMTSCNKVSSAAGSPTTTVPANQNHEKYDFCNSNVKVKDVENYRQGDTEELDSSLNIETDPLAIPSPDNLKLIRFGAQNEKPKSSNRANKNFKSRGGFNSSPALDNISSESREMTIYCKGEKVVGPPFKTKLTTKTTTDLTQRVATCSDKDNHLYILPDLDEPSAGYSSSDDSLDETSFGRSSKVPKTKSSSIFPTKKQRKATPKRKQSTSKYIRDPRKRRHWGSEVAQKCEICSQILANAASMRNHVKIVHMSEAKVRCTLCDFQALWPSKLITHMSTAHSREKKFKCRMCGKGFKANFILIRHERTHKGDFKCDICASPFVCKVSLERHQEEGHCARKTE